MGALMLTFFSLVTRFTGMAYRLYLTGRIGAEGIGLYQLIMSVYTLFATFATAGFSVAVSRLAAEKMTDNKVTASSVRVLYRSMAVSGAVALFAMGLMLLFSDVLACSVMNDARIALPVRVLALSMPFIALSGCLKGFFLAQGRAWKNAVSMVVEQAVKIGSSLILFFGSYSAVTDSGELCTAIVIGTLLGEAASFVFLWILFVFTPKEKGKGEKFGVKQLLSVAAPIAASSYITSLLHAGEGMLIPLCLTRYGGDYAGALAEYGMIRGMAIPLLFFPFAFLSSLVSLLIPDLSRDNLSEDKTRVRLGVTRVLVPAILFSAVIGLVFFVFPERIAVVFYGNADCSQALRVLAAVTPAMYIETLCDGMLKALGYQRFTLVCTFCNGILRIVSTVTVVPACGVDGYLAILVISNLFTFAMCYFKLRSVTGFRASEAIPAFLKAKKRISPRPSPPRPSSRVRRGSST